MEKMELAIDKINVEGNDKIILTAKYETVKKIEIEIEFISTYIERYYKFLKLLVIDVLKGVNSQNIDIITIFEKLYQIEDEQIEFKKEFDYWYRNWCYISECDCLVIERFDWILIEKFDWLSQKINEDIENINKKFEDIKQTLIDNNKQIYDLIGEDLEEQYKHMIKKINENVKNINKISKQLIDYGIVESEEE